MPKAETSSEFDGPEPQHKVRALPRLLPVPPQRRGHSRATAWKRVSQHPAPERQNALAKLGDAKVNTSDEPVLQQRGFPSTQSPLASRKESSFVYELLEEFGKGLAARRAPGCGGAQAAGGCPRLPPALGHVAPRSPQPSHPTPCIPDQPQQLGK